MQQQQQSRRETARRKASDTPAQREKERAWSATRMEREKWATCCLPAMQFKLHSICSRCNSGRRRRGRTTKEHAREQHNSLTGQEEASKTLFLSLSTCSKFQFSQLARLSNLRGPTKVQQVSKQAGGRPILAKKRQVAGATGNLSLSWQLENLPQSQFSVTWAASGQLRA